MTNEKEPDNADYYESIIRARILKNPDIRRGRSTYTLEFRAARGLADKGDAFAQQQDYDSAIEAYTEAINLDDETPVWYAKRGNAYFKKEAWAEAFADYSKVLRYYPQNKDYQEKAAICEAQYAKR
jgi:tetratricopeptide (TPR) repeat protein